MTSITSSRELWRALEMLWDIFVGSDSAPGISFRQCWREEGCVTLVSRQWLVLRVNALALRLAALSTEWSLLVAFQTSFATGQASGRGSQTSSTRRSRLPLLLWVMNILHRASHGTSASFWLLETRNKEVRLRNCAHAENGERCVRCLETVTGSPQTALAICGNGVLGPVPVA